MAGAVEVWDLCDQTNKPSLTAPIVSSPLTSLAFPPDFKNERAVRIPSTKLCVMLDQMDRIEDTDNSSWQWEI